MTAFNMTALRVDLLHRGNTQPCASQALIHATICWVVQYNTAAKAGCWWWWWIPWCQYVTVILRLSCDGCSRLPAKTRLPRNWSMCLAAPEHWTCLLTLITWQGTHGRRGDRSRSRATLVHNTLPPAGKCMTAHPCGTGSQGNLLTGGCRAHAKSLLMFKRVSQSASEHLTSSCSCSNATSVNC